MINAMKIKIKKNIRHLKHRYLILKIKWVLLFVLPIITIVIAYQVSKQFLNNKLQGLQFKLH